MYKWLLPTMSEVLALGEAVWAEANLEPLPETIQPDATDNTPLIPNSTAKARNSYARQLMRAEREWTGAIAALNQLLRQFDARSTAHLANQGLVLSGPSPVLNQDLTDRFANWVFSSQSFNILSWIPLQLLPAAGQQAVCPQETPAALPLLPVDPLATEQFCLVSTSAFCLLMVLGENAEGEPLFLYSFDPHVVQQAWKSLRPRVLLTSPHQVGRIDQLFEQFAPIHPDYRIVTQFSRLLLQQLPEPEEDLREAGDDLPSETTGQANPEQDEPVTQSPLQGEPDVELLQAIAHEIRTPLATIRTLTRSLLRRKDLPPEVLKRLEMIDRECSEQIDRFSLIFKAVELETSMSKSSSMPLTATSLDRVLQDSIPRWQQQAQQRNLTLDVILPQQMPTVVSDPTMLDQALTGLIERFTRSLPAGSHIRVLVTPAGDRLKLEFQAQQEPEQSDHATGSCPPTLKSLGQLLMFQPETGSLSLNLAVTKNLFQALGGKLIVRQRPQQGEVLTIFLPLDAKSSEIRII